jgi:hypothetical protein
MPTPGAPGVLGKLIILTFIISKDWEIGRASNTDQDYIPIVIMPKERLNRRINASNHFTNFIKK